mmetsp:Transcript_16265/g.37464  ORF Transcript_16265/g.37464 Transcript_16265/m.37464 type:complete len:227 (+) Transcript_16265:134-814(+)
MPLLGTGFSIGSSGNDEGMGKSLDDIIADRRKEQAKASTGKNTKKNSNSKTDAKAKKTAVADRSIATGRAKRAAANRARRGLSGTNNNNNADNNTNGKKAKPSAMEVEKEVYRQARKTADSKKKAEQKKTQGRLPPNSSLRSKKNNKTKAGANANDPPGIVTGMQPSQKQIKAALKGMETAGCPIPNGYQIMVQFIPPAAAPAPAKGKGSQAKKTTGGRGGRGGKK